MNDEEKGAIIKVVGVGGGGGNAINNMIEAGLKDVDFIAVNTDAQVLSTSIASTKVQIGKNLTHGLGAGSDPEAGKNAALEDIEDLKQNIKDADMLFITAGMGGGTGTGASPIIAKLAKDNGMLTVGVVTKPFDFEGRQRIKVAEQGIEELGEIVDSIIIIPNQKLFEIASKETSLLEAFKMVDDVLRQAVQGVTDLVNMPGLVNPDFADIRTVMSEKGRALMGVGESSGENRAKIAAEAAISNPLLDDVSIEEAKGILMNITASETFGLHELKEITTTAEEVITEGVNFKFGVIINNSMNDKIRVTIIATGFEGKKMPIYRLKKSRIENIEKKVATETFEDKLDIPTFIRKGLRKKEKK
ncbi:MAG: cell division protein FtsZ [Deltaproteobacteria bacterium]|nr:cell division protein FtsZ [Deltaproteobacteria bacterium]